MIWVMLPFKRALDMIQRMEIFYYLSKINFLLMEG